MYLIIVEYCYYVSSISRSSRQKIVTNRKLLLFTSLNPNNNHNNRYYSRTRNPSKKYRVVVTMEGAIDPNSDKTTTQETFMDALSKAASKSLNRSIQFQSTSGGGYSGGGGASTSAVIDPETGNKYFIKSAVGEHDMLKAEYIGVKTMDETNTIKVPKPIAYGEYEARRQAFVIFEYLEMSSGGSQYNLGQQLAKMHRNINPNGLYGFHINNAIGATSQPNLPWINNWSDFWDQHRLGHMLQLTNNAQCSNDTIQKLRMKTKELLSLHETQPSLVHGDLWGGNKCFCKVQTDDGNHNIIPCIFDPATYYGDREVDIAMTYLFGGYNNDFYKGYEDEWPLSVGHEQRRTIYNLYHILNHNVLFGGSYINQARNMIDTILRY